MDRRQFLHATGVITTAVGSSGALLTAARAQASERHPVGAPVMRRFDEERWVLDNLIQANGIDWDQPHTAILLRACGPRCRRRYERPQATG